MKRKILFSFILILLIIPTIAFAFREDIREPVARVPGEIEDLSTEIIGVIRWAGYAIAIGMLIYIGIKYVMAAANEKASLKQTAINYVIGAIIVGGVTSVLTFAVQFLGGEVGVTAEWGDGEEQVTECEHTYGEAGIVGEDGGAPQLQFVCTKCGAIQEGEN